MSSPATRSASDPLAVYSAGNIEGLRLAAAAMSASELLRKGSDERTPEERTATVMVKMMAAIELGVPAVTTGTTTLYVMHGRLAMEAKLLRTLAMRSGLVRVLEWSPPEDGDPEATCILHLERTDGSGLSHKAHWTLSKAKAKGLIKGGSSWSTWPERMTGAKCWADCVHWVAPDAIGGMACVADFGYTDEEARFAPEDDPAKPVGMEWAEDFRRRLGMLADQQGNLAKLQSEKIERYGSPDYKLQAIPVGDKDHWEQWLRDRQAEAGKRIGLQAAEELWHRVKQVAAAAGIAEAELVDEVNGWIAERGKKTAADLSETDAREVAGWLAARLETPAEQVIEADFEPEAKAAWVPTPLGGGREQRLEVPTDAGLFGDDK